MIHLYVNGFSWGVAYWLAVVAVGIVLDIDNLRHAWLQVRGAGRATVDRRPLSASTLGNLSLNVATSVGLIVSGVPAMLFQMAALRHVQPLEFSSAAAAVAFIGIILGLASGPTITALAIWLWRWNVTRVDRQGQRGAGFDPATASYPTIPEGEREP